MSSKLSPADAAAVLAYLNRISFTLEGDASSSSSSSSSPSPIVSLASVLPTLSTLDRLIKCHWYAVPFSNSYLHVNKDGWNDPQKHGQQLQQGEQKQEEKGEAQVQPPHFASPSGIPPTSLSSNKVLEAAYEHVVLKRRGALCTEKNPLFAWLLQSLGYSVTLAKANVTKPNGEIDSVANHTTIFVRVPNLSSPSSVPHPSLSHAPNEFYSSSFGQIYIVDIGFAIPMPIPLLFNPTASVVEYTLPSFSVDDARLIRIVHAEQPGFFDMQWRLENKDQVSSSFWPVPDDTVFPVYQTRMRFSFSSPFSVLEYHRVLDWVRDPAGPFMSGIMVVKNDEKERTLLLARNLYSERGVLNKEAKGRLIVTRSPPAESTSQILEDGEQIAEQLAKLEQL